MPANQKPSFTAYTVQKREGQDDFWTAIGAAFMHQDGEGYNIVLSALPLDGKIVLRLPKERSEETSQTPDKSNVRSMRRRRQNAPA